MACRQSSMTHAWNLSVDGNHHLLIMNGPLSGSFGLRRSKIEVQKNRIGIVSAGDFDL